MNTHTLTASDLTFIDEIEAAGREHDARRDLLTVTLDADQVAIYDGGDASAQDAMMRELWALMGGRGEILHPAGFVVDVRY